MRRFVIAILLLTSIVFDANAGRRRAVRHLGPSIAAPVATGDSDSLLAGATLTIAAPGVLANDTLNSASIVSVGPLTGAEQTAMQAEVRRRR